MTHLVDSLTCKLLWRQEFPGFGCCDKKELCHFLQFSLFAYNQEQVNLFCFFPAVGSQNQETMETTQIPAHFSVHIVWIDKQKPAAACVL